MTMSLSELPGFVPDWPAPPRVCSWITTREGGASQGVFRGFNLGDHVGDDPVAVTANRARLRTVLGVSPLWLAQVHGTAVVDAAAGSEARDENFAENWVPTADAAFSRRPGVACAMMTADCLPLLFCDESATVVAAAHAGWRGLCGGVIEATVAAMALPGQRLLAYLGPAIGPAAFEVGDEVRRAFVAADVAAASAFIPHGSGKWLADLYALARQRLRRCGIERIYGGACCTFSDADRFFSYRRDGQTGRMASLIWLAD